MSFCSLIKGVTPKISMLCFVITDSVLVNVLCVWMETKRHGTAQIIEQYVSVTTKPATERTPTGEVKEEDNGEKKQEDVEK